MTGDIALQTDKETGPIDVAKYVAAERKATIIRQAPKKRSQSNAYVARAHQRKCRSHVQNHERGNRRQSKNQTERDRKHHDFDDTQLSCKHVSLLEGTVKHHSRDDITKTTQASFYHLDQLLMRKSETKRLNAANWIPLEEEPQRVTSTSSEQHWMNTQQGQFEQRTIKKFGAVVSSRVRKAHRGHRGARTAKRKFGCQKSDTGQRSVGTRTQESSETFGMRWARPQDVRRAQAQEARNTALDV